MTQQQATEQVIGKAILTAVLYNESPLVMGAGKGDYTDKILQTVDGQPYLDAESLGGALRSHIRKHFDIPTDLLDMTFGSEKEENGKDNSQSHLRISDGFPLDANQPRITVFDGIRIEPKTGLVEDGKKYDYEAVGNRCAFVVNMELTLREMHRDYKDLFLQLLATIAEVFKTGEFRAGAFTRTGFGILETADAKPAVWKFFEANGQSTWSKFLTKRNEETKKRLDAEPNAAVFGVAWLSESGQEAAAVKPFERIPAVTLSLQATYTLQDTLITGGGKRMYLGYTRESDKVMTEFNGTPFVSGKSFKGALNTVMRRILHSRFNEPDKVEQVMQHINGFVHEQKQDAARQAKASRLSLHGFAIVKDMAEPFLRDRIAIDAFSGGGLPGKKFDSSPLVAKTDKQLITVSLNHHNPHPFELGLLALCLRELGSERSSLGGESALGAGILELQKFTLDVDAEQKKAINEAWKNADDYLSSIQTPTS